MCVTDKLDFNYHYMKGNFYGSIPKHSNKKTRKTQTLFSTLNALEMWEEAALLLQEFYHLHLNEEVGLQQLYKFEVSSD